jgi:hypothetical protein
MHVSYRLINIAWAFRGIGFAKFFGKVRMHIIDVPSSCYHYQDRRMSMKLFIDTDLRSNGVPCPLERRCPEEQVKARREGMRCVCVPGSLGSVLYCHPPCQILLVARGHAPDNVLRTALSAEHIQWRELLASHNVSAYSLRYI